MGFVKLRGQEVNLDEKHKTLCFRVHKPLGNTFSISDSIKHYVDNNYKCLVCFSEKRMEINKETPFIRKEPVASKFPGGPNWYRYWYNLTDKNQMGLFDEPINNK